MSDSPAPYDNTSGQRTLTQAMRELKAFRDRQPIHDLSIIRRNSNQATEKMVEPVEAPKKVKRNKRQVEGEE